MRTYTRDDVQTHYGSDRPAVNVKIYRDLSDGFRDLSKYGDDAPEGFTEEWVRETFSDQYLDEVFWITCGWEFEYLESWATSPDDALFPDHHVTLEQDGRSGGWVVVTGLPDIEEWDAILLARWRKFERIARELADDIPYQWVTSLLYNEWEAREVETAEQARAANQDIATVPA